MKTLTLDDNLYSALEEEAHRVGCTVGELLSDAVSYWLSDAVLDDAERAEIESARAEAAEKGGIEVDEFFDQLLEEPN